MPAGTTILEAAKKVAVNIPTLCHHPDVKAWAACGICVVRNGNSPKLLRACCTEVAEGMKITTHDPDIVQIRKTVVQLILSTHPADCLKCPRSGVCELQRVATDFGIREAPFPRPAIDHIPRDESTPSIVLDPDKCIKCGRCAIVCQEMQNVWALEFIGRGERMRIAPAAGVPLNDSPCIKCGQCSAHCPVGAIYERDETAKVWDALRDPQRFTAVQIAPAVRVALGEAFGMKPGEISTGKIYTALRRLGFQAVFDTNFSADLTIMEEGTEFVHRFTQGGELPLITSCCPSWTDWMEKYAADFIPNFSTAKSPQQMLGVMAKTYFAEKMGLDPARIHLTSIMPCTAKKYEITRSEEMRASGHQDVDVVLTTRELARMIKIAGIDFNALPESPADSILGEYTGAGTLFGATGGVMEAALRTAYHLITHEELADVNFTAVRGLQGVKEASRRRHQRHQGLHRRRPPDGQRRGRPQRHPRRPQSRAPAPLAVHRGHGLPRRLHRRRRPAHPRHRRGPPRPHGRPLPRRPPVRPPLLPPEPPDQENLHRLPGRALQRKGPQAPPHPLHRQAPLHRLRPAPSKQSGAPTGAPDCFKEGLAPAQGRTWMSMAEASERTS